VCKTCKHLNHQSTKLVDGEGTKVFEMYKLKCQVNMFLVFSFTRNRNKQREM